MDVNSKPRLSKEEVQQIIDNRLAIIIEKEILQSDADEEIAKSAKAATLRRKVQRKKRD